MEFKVDGFLVDFHAVYNELREILISGSFGWETGSVCFDTVKIYAMRVYIKGDAGQAGLAFIPVVKYE